MRRTLTCYDAESVQSSLSVFPPSLKTNAPAHTVLRFLGRFQAKEEQSVASSVTSEEETVVEPASVDDSSAPSKKKKKKGKKSKDADPDNKSKVADQDNLND